MPEDPRDIVTPDAFTVAPEVLGRRTASPFRRLVAFGIDNTAVGLLSALPGAVFGLVGVLVLLRVAAVRPGIPRRLRRALVVGAVLLALAVVGGLVRGLRDFKGGPEVGVVAGDTKLRMNVGDAIGFVGDLIALNAAKTETERAEAARLLVDHVREAEKDPAVARALVLDIASEVEDPLTRQAVAEALDVSPLAPRPGDRPEPAALRALADAIETGAPGAEALRAELAPRLATPELAQKQLELSQERARVDELQERVRGLERPRGVKAAVAGLLDDLGFGFGWFFLYFTVTTAGWQGRSPGKRLMGIRVVRLDGKPLTAWNAFNRAGGYAASAATGLLGFAQVFWDRNRQALHDKIADTVVVREAVEA